MMVMPGLGAVCPAMVRLLALIVNQLCRSAGDSLMVLTTSKSIVRPPLGALLMP